MKVMHIISSLGGGGRERRMSQLVKSLSEHPSFQQEILIYSDSKNDYLSAIPDSVKVRNINGSSKYRFILNIYNAIKDFRPDIVHVWSEVNLVLLPVSIFKHLFHYKLIIGFLADGNRLKSLNRHIVKFSYLNANAIVSNSMAGLIAKEATGRKSHVIYNGFDFGRIKSIKAQSVLRDEFKLKKEKVIGMFARFSVAKNWEMFVDIAASYKNTDNIKFLAVGDGEKLEAIRHYAKRNHVDNIIFTGRRDDVESIMKMTDITLLLSNEMVHAEGVSNSIMESMASKKPVIATRGGGTPEIINSGINGFIIEPNDVAAAVEDINILLSDEDLLHSFGEKAFHEINNRFLLSHMTEQYIKLYQSL